MPVTSFARVDPYSYLPGFNTYHETSSSEVPDALPVAMNSPQQPPHGLFAEKLSGTSFTAPRHENQQTWLYRVLPSSAHEPFVRVGGEGSSSGKSSRNADDSDGEQYHFVSSRLRSRAMQLVPDQLRWDPFPLPQTQQQQQHKPIDWVQGLHPIAGAGDPALRQGLDIYMYAANASMDAQSAFYSADGDLLLVPQQGSLDIRTELGYLMVRPGEICVIPRGIRFNVGLVNDTDADRSSSSSSGTAGVAAAARGYALELYQGHFQLPELGPIGSNGLANSGDFQAPQAAFERVPDCLHQRQFSILAKFGGALHRARQQHSCFDVVAWKGNYYPYKYDLGRFNTIGSISYDHPDPSIFTVLTAPSHQVGTAIADFVIFPPRWLVAEGTFRPPYYHRNCMSEFMGMIKGEYDGKAGGGFLPGGASLHSAFSGHGPDAATFEAASSSAAELKPAWTGAGSMAFMFESCLMLAVTQEALQLKSVQHDYTQKSWQKLQPAFRLR